MRRQASQLSCDLLLGGQRRDQVEVLHLLAQKLPLRTPNNEKYKTSNRRTWPTHGARETSWLWQSFSFSKHYPTQVSGSYSVLPQHSKLCNSARAPRFQMVAHEDNKTTQLVLQSKLAFGCIDTNAHWLYSDLLDATLLIVGHPRLFP